MTEENPGLLPPCQQSWGSCKFLNDWLQATEGGQAGDLKKTENKGIAGNQFSTCDSSLHPQLMLSA